MKSEEIRKQLGDLNRKTRAIYAQIEQAKARQRESTAGSLAWMDLDDEIKSLEAQLPAFPKERRALNREFARVLGKEIEDLRDQIKEARGAIEPKLQAFIDELEKIHRTYEGKIQALAKPYLPEGASLPDIAISMRIQNQSFGYAPFDNALVYLRSPLESALHSKTAELEQVMRELGR